MADLPNNRAETDLLMATITVSTASELRSAVGSAGNGDTILLANGSYGDVSLKGASNLTIRAQGSGADFDGLSLRNADNVTVDGIKIDGDTDSAGYGTGTGLDLRASSDVTIQNSEITDFYKGIQVWNVDGLRIASNTLDNIAYDGMVLGHVRDTVITGNDVTMHGRESIDHKDAIQFYNQGSAAPSSNVVISNNHLTAVDPNFHGIYMGNADAKATGSSSEYYSDVTITGNVIDSQNMLGIAVGETDGLDIRGNVVLQNAGTDSSRPIHTPRIMVAADADDVTIAGNTVLDTPTAATSNWQEASISGSGWSISGNAQVALSTSVSGYLSGKAGASSGSSETEASTVTGETGLGETAASDSAAGSVTGSGAADSFRFVGVDVDGDTGASFAGVDFGAGDVLKLGRYDAGTFADTHGGNVVENSVDGSYVKIDSLADIAEIAAASEAVSAEVSGDDLRVTITQDSGTLDLVLEGLGADYQSGQDDLLF